MGKNKKQNVPDESHLALPPPATPDTPIIDTHTHLVPTFAFYKSKYPFGKFDTIWDFVQGLYRGRNVCAIVDVWCDAPVPRVWKEIADSALVEEDRATRWAGIEYWFVMGVHPHDAKQYDDAVEQSILEAMAHPRCVGWGEIGLDYHYDHSPRDVQRRVFARQLEHAVALGKPLTIHTREAEDDTERLLKEHVPVDHKIHIHCFTDSPAFARRLLDHFPNLYVGITGVISYSTNLNTAALVRHMSTGGSSDGDVTTSTSATTVTATPRNPDDGPRILLETDAPYMVPSNIYASLPELRGKRLPLCHSAMIPWVAEFIADEIRGTGGEGSDDGGCNAADVMRWANRNARAVYGV